jgi:hypothetical protein
MRASTLSSPITLIALALAATSCQSTPTAEAEPAPPPARTFPGPVTAASTGITLQGQITALDKPTRAVTVAGNDGSSLTVKAGPEVRNFDQLKVGDRVLLDYRAAVALDLQPAGSDQVGITSAQANTVPIRGATPGGAMTNTITLVTEVAAVDPVANTIALRGPSGNTQLIAVEREDLRAKLPSVKRGDLLRISYTEAVALGIRRDTP